MRLALVFLLAWLPSFAANTTTSSSLAALIASGQAAIFPIDSMVRGKEIFNIFESLIIGGRTQVPEFAIQTILPPTSPYSTYQPIINGLIPYVQDITETPNDTLLIITYQSTQNAGIQQYIVLPVEQVTALLYFRTIANLPNSTQPFTAYPPPGVIPYYSVDPILRAQDIASAVTQLKAAPFVTSPQNQVWIQTTLTGPFNPAIQNGLIQNVLSISASNGLLQINFKQLSQTLPQFIIVSPEQVQQIIWIRNPLVSL